MNPPSPDAVDGGGAPSLTTYSNPRRFFNGMTRSANSSLRRIGQQTDQAIPSVQTFADRDSLLPILATFCYCSHQFGRRYPFVLSFVSFLVNVSILSFTVPLSFCWPIRSSPSDRIIASSSWSIGPFSIGQHGDVPTVEAGLVHMGGELWANTGCGSGWTVGQRPWAGLGRLAQCTEH